MGRCFLDPKAAYMGLAVLINTSKLTKIFGTVILKEETSRQECTLCKLTSVGL